MTKNAVRLREVTEADLPTFYEHQRDPDANRMAAFPPRDREAFMTHWAKILSDDGLFKKTIEFEGAVAGNIVSWHQHDRQAIGYWIGKEFWGKGIGTRALTEFLGQIAIRPLFAYVAKHNVGSIRILQKCGFTVVGEDQGPSGTEGEPVEEFIYRLD